jgi:hypothetical protein
MARGMRENRRVRWEAPQSDARQRWRVVAAAGALFAAIFVVRIVDGNVDDAVTLLYLMPIALVAVEFGLAGGTIAAVLACGLLGIWVATDDPGLTPVGFSTRAVAFLAVGTLDYLLGRKPKWGEMKRKGIGVRGA